MSYNILINGTQYNLASLIDTSGGAITTLYFGFPTSTPPTATYNFEPLSKPINYLEGTVDLSNKCTALSFNPNISGVNYYYIPPGISKVSGIFAGAGGGGGGGGATGNADNGNNNDSGGGGGGGGSGAILVLNNYPVSAGQEIVISLGPAGAGANENDTNAATDGRDGGTTNLEIARVKVCAAGGGQRGFAGKNGNANNVGIGGLGGVGGVNEIPLTSYVTYFVGNPGAPGNNANKGSPGKGGNGGLGSSGATNVYPYNSPGGTGNNPNNNNTNGIGTTGSPAPTSTNNLFSGGGGGGSGSGQGRHDIASGGGSGSGGFAIVYLYF